MFLAKILVPEGTEDVKVGAALALIVEDKADVAAVQAAVAAGATPPAATAAAPASQAGSPPQGHGHASAAAGPAVDAASLPATSVMPSARALMQNAGVNAAALVGKGSGKAGRITKGDVLALLGKAPPQAAATTTAAAQASAPAGATPTQLQQPAQAPSQAASGAGAPPQPQPIPATAGPVERPGGGKYTDAKPSQVRRVIASRLTESKARIPHQYAVMDCEIDGLLALRAQLKTIGINVSVNDLVVKAAARALREMPEVNCYYDSKTDSVRANSTVDISVAVATEGGLITPIVKGADGLSVAAINERVKDLATRARANKLKPEEFQGGSFTISNLGMYGIDSFSAVINPPQACILAVGKGERKPVLPPLTDLDSEALVLASGKAPKSPVQPRTATVMSVMMSSDARVLDDAAAARFLSVFKHYVQSPGLLN